MSRMWHQFECSRDEKRISGSVSFCLMFEDLPKIVLNDFPGDVFQSLGGLFQEVLYQELVFRVVSKVGSESLFGRNRERKMPKKMK